VASKKKLRKLLKELREKGKEDAFYEKVRGALERASLDAVGYYSIDRNYVRVDICLSASPNLCQPTELKFYRVDKGAEAHVFIAYLHNEEQLERLMKIVDALRGFERVEVTACRCSSLPEEKMRSRGFIKLYSEDCGLDWWGLVL